jgi:hypothetical protein
MEASHGNGKEEYCIKPPNINPLEIICIRYKQSDLEAAEDKYVRVTAGYLGPLGVDEWAYSGLVALERCQPTWP